MRKKRPSGRVHLLGGPYPFRESLGWFWRNIRGIRTKNTSGIQPLPQQTVHNFIAPRITLGFLGDIMETGKKRLIIFQEIQAFLGDCDFLVGNFEGTLTDARKASLFAQRHDPSILDALVGLFPPDRTFLSIANNHAGDFGGDISRQSLDALRGRGFHVFGLRRKPFAILGGCVEVAAASMWSNRPCGEVAFFDSFGSCSEPSAFRIAYPHWGYELELFPRPAIVEEGRKLLEGYDAVIGHHPHVPQPLTACRIGDQWKLLAFSLGDFCTRLPIRKFQHGIVCKISIGPDEQGEWRIGTVCWRYTRVVPAAGGSLKVAFVTEPQF